MRLLFGAMVFTMAGLSADGNWQKILAERIPAFGHRNWIVVADSAYPSQAREGIETVVTDGSQLEVLTVVLAALDKTKHVTPVAHTDLELNYLEDNQAAGVEAYRDKLAALLKDRTVEAEPHEAIIEKLDRVSQKFRVLVIKTNMTVPYTSVFLELDCAYWSPDAEKGLRAKMRAAGVR